MLDTCTESAALFPPFPQVCDWDWYVDDGIDPPAIPFRHGHIAQAIYSLSYGLYRSIGTIHSY
jgi:hypothetical protein